MTEVTRAGFRINHNKIRMQLRGSQQIVTGLTVNQKVNIRADYYRKARIMCSSLFNHGHYFTQLAPPGAPAAVGFSVPPAKTTAATTPAAPVPKLITATAPLEGVLSHIFHIKQRQVVASEPDEEVRKNRDNKTKYTAFSSLYKKFLYYWHFVAPTAPLIVCEGKTDNIYLRSALKGLSPAYPQLAEVKDGKLFTKISFLKHSRVEHDILQTIFRVMSLPPRALSFHIAS